MSQPGESAVERLSVDLIERASVTPNDQGCQQMLAERLEQAGMQVEHLRFNDVDNLFATHGEGSPHLLLLGHTDVVPPGPEAQWNSPPFQPSIRGDYLFGRGTADMKCSVAALVIASEAVLNERPDHSGRLSILLTSDEEGPAQNGVRKVVPELEARDLLPDFVLVGEPSSSATLGDTIRIGRRGSIQAKLHVEGQQGHTAYADPDDNPAHRAGPMLAALGSLDFNDGSEHFPPTRLQISNLKAGTGAENVTPGELQVWFNIRYNPSQTADGLREQIKQLIERHDPGPCTLSWRLSGEPFGPAQGPLLDAVNSACAEMLGSKPEANTGGGTSDGRFFGPLGIEVVELGPVNKTIHQINECIALKDLKQLPELYRRILSKLLA